MDDLWCQVMNPFDHIPRSQESFDHCTDTWIDNNNFKEIYGITLDVIGLELTTVLREHHRINTNLSTSNPNLCGY